MFKPKGVIVLLQSLLVVIGFLALRSVNRLYYVAELPDNVSRLMRVLHGYGLFLWLIPILWTLYVRRAERIDRGIWTYSVACGIGFLSMGLIIFLFLYAMIRPNG